MSAARARDAFVAALGLALFATEGAWLGESSRLAVWLLFALGISGAPLAGAPRSLPLRLLSVAAIVGPCVALLLGRDLADGRSPQVVPALALGTLFFVWSATVELARSSVQASRSAALGWVVLGLAPALWAAVVVQAAPANVSFAWIEDVSFLGAAHGLARGDAVAWALPFALSCGVLCATAALARAGREA